MADGLLMKQMYILITVLYVIIDRSSIILL
jgi:hypothetical protein